MESKEKNFNWDYVLIGTVYAAILVFLYHTLQISQADSRLFPYIVLIICTFLNTTLLVKTLITAKFTEPPKIFVGGKRAFLIVACMLVYIIGIVFVGFYIATPIYLFATMYLFGQRNKKVMIAISAIVPLFVFLTFELIMKLPIPKGMLFK